MEIRWLFPTAIVALAAVACGTGANDPVSAAATGPVATTVAPATHHVSFSTTGTNQTWAPTLCDETQHCLYPFTMTSTVTGDLEGSLRTAGGFALNEDATYDVMGLHSFTGTVAGCGTGTLVLDLHLVASATDGYVDWTVATDWGTGDLTRVTGHGRSPAAMAPSERGLYEGDIACPKG